MFEARASGTRERILDTAERLFGDRGIVATSLRDITAEAGVNVASVNYHFGSKHALLADVLERRLRPINQQRLALLDLAEAEAANGPLPLESVVRAFLRPPFERQRAWGAEAQSSFLRLVGRIHNETDESYRRLFIRQFDDVARRFRAALAQALPHHRQADVNRRMLFMLGSMAFTMLWGAALLHEAAHADHDPEEVLESLILYTVGGMAAPAAAGTPLTTVASAGRHV